MKRGFIILLFFSTLIKVGAQVESPVSILFSDSLDANRKVTGLHSVKNSTDGMNVNTYASGKAIYATASGTNALSITLPYTPVVTDGFLIHVKATAINTGDISLSVNGSTAYAVKKYTGANVGPGEIQAGQVVTLIFDGTVFQVIGKLNRPCLNGFVSVSDEFCIDPTPRNISNFYQAIDSCGKHNAMLCTWNQWYRACIDSTNNGSTDYLTNFEWVNDAGNNGSDAKVAGYNDAAAYTGYGCKKSYSLPPTKTFHNALVETSGINVNIRYRCCYRK